MPPKGSTKKEPRGSRVDDLGASDPSSKASEESTKSLDLDSIDGVLQAVSTPDGLLQMMRFLTDDSKKLQEYKQQVEAQLESDHALIEEMSSQMAQLQRQNDELQRALRDTQENSSTIPAYESPIRKKNPCSRVSPQSQTSPNKRPGIEDPVAREFENIGFSLDMLELLTGLRICNFDEDHEKYFFDIHQTSSTSSPAMHVDYVLIIPKLFGQVAEVCYVPSFLEHIRTGNYEEKHNAQRLRDTLPEYLCANLTFPYSTLAQFYAKMTRAINRRR